MQLDAELMSVGVVGQKGTEKTIEIPLGEERCGQGMISLPVEIRILGEATEGLSLGSIIVVTSLNPSDEIV
jgi:hypothetical protein